MGEQKWMAFMSDLLIILYAESQEVTSYIKGIKQPTVQ